MKKDQTSEQDESAALLSNQFINFLESRPLISVRGLEKAVNMPNDTIRKAKESKGKRGIPEKYFYQLGLILRDYGFDWRGFGVAIPQSRPTISIGEGQE